MARPTDQSTPPQSVVADLVARARTASTRTELTTSQPSPGSRRGVVLGIDGPSGAGKTTLADAVSAELDCPVVHMDDLYAGWGGLEEAVPRLAQTVLEPYWRGEPISQPRWDWTADEWGEPVAIPSSTMLVVEGCGCTVMPAGALVTVRVWVDGPADLRRRRGLARDGAVFAPHWDAWAEQEDRLFSADRTRERADVALAMWGG